MVEYKHTQIEKWKASELFPFVELKVIYTVGSRLDFYTGLCGNSREIP